MEGKVNKIIDEILESTTVIALQDAHINSDETNLLRILKEEFEYIRSEVSGMELNHLPEQEIRMRIKMVARNTMNKLTSKAIEDGKITPDEMSILHNVIRKLM